MAKLAKRNKGKVPTIEQASDNLGTPNEPTKRVNFVVPASFAKQYKQFAFDQDVSMTELFKRTFDFYRKAMNK
jgi:hypothetical protein